MSVQMNRTGVGCKCFGAWLLITAAILVYGETAPSNSSPAFTIPLLLLGMGAGFYYFGCLSCTRAHFQKPDPD